ncbi:MAG TPA: M23 family metallopeptidase, partial [Polyangiaceae bacterium]|nr:M23 family metallopeptidase [Polyangiaceae bacterium]
MRSLYSGLLVLTPAMLSFLFAVDASATKLRRPFVADLSFNYGFDNNGSAAGCTDHECGSRCYNGHGGNDYALPLGTDVLAPADGVVVATHDGCPNYGGLGNTCGTGCGNYVKIKLADGNFVLFCHFQLGSLKVANGDSVKCGQVVGKSASSGN